MKIYLVTGASRGIGKATAEKMLTRGDTVYGTYHTAGLVAEEMQHKYAQLTMLQTDLGSYESIDQLVNTLQGVRLDGIVNSAGIFEEVDFDAFDIDALERNFRVNAFAPVYLVHGFKDCLNDGGAIVNVSSTDAMVGSNAGMGYSASKAAISNLTLSLANVFAPRRIRVNGVAPGWVGDGMRAPQELLDLAKDYNPLKRLGNYEDMANVICFLLSDEAAYVNGTVMVADGGDMTKNYILDKESELVSD